MEKSIFGCWKFCFMIDWKRERVLEQTDKKALTTDFRISKGKQNNVHIKSILTVHTTAQANMLGQEEELYTNKTRK